MVEPRGEERIKGTAGRGGASYPGNVLYCGSSWLRSSWQPPCTYMLGPEKVWRRATAKARLPQPGQLTERPPLFFRHLRPPRSRGTTSTGRVSRAGSGSKAQRRKAQSTNGWAAAVEDLKTRHAAAAPIRPPRPVSRRASCSASRSPRVPAFSHRAPRPLTALSSLVSLRPRRMCLRLCPAPIRCPLTQTPALSPPVRVAAHLRRVGRALCWPNLVAISAGGRPHPSPRLFPPSRFAGPPAAFFPSPRNLKQPRFSSTGFWLLMLQTIKYWSIELKKRLKPDGVSFCHLGWSTVMPSWLIATSASWVQAVLVPQPPK
ncbi:mitochondrial glutathione transporter SLC25A40 isoform X2 [Callithrix jacchus]|uniref:probable mitochondrial glutathione transporter SLC25A40 isoform X2 n=1 Tax=Callithrix jacchus TaxID=9483 RepID=UPI0023DCF4AC|nr:probable mitochondrial glutathione transporter SLC25A40 isoform X2 [Callithrix jacchus]